MTNASEMKVHYLKLARDHTRRMKTVTREQAIPYISFCVDDALSERSIDDMPDNARLVGWQCGFEPMFVACWSYMDGKLTDDEAIELATDLLEERKWFSGETTEPDYIL